MSCHFHDNRGFHIYILSSCMHLGLPAFMVICHGIVGYNIVVKRLIFLLPRPSILVGYRTCSYYNTICVVNIALTHNTDLFANEIELQKKMDRLFTK